MKINIFKPPYSWILISGGSYSLPLNLIPLIFTSTYLNTADFFCSSLVRVFSLSDWRFPTLCGGQILEKEKAREASVTSWGGGRVLTDEILCSAEASFYLQFNKPPAKETTCEQYLAQYIYQTLTDCRSILRISLHPTRKESMEIHLRWVFGFLVSLEVVNLTSWKFCLTYWQTKKLEINMHWISS